MGSIVLYEGNGGSQDIVHATDDQPGQDFRPRKNDEARSLKLLAVRAGCVISLFDHPKGHTTDDFCIIEVKKSLPEYTVTTFQRSYEDDVVIVSYASRNGLDGKVSRVRIS